MYPPALLSPILLVLTLLIVCYPMPSYAYIDPGTGSMLIQLLIAGAISAIVAIKMFFHTIKSKCLALKSRFSKKGGDSEKQ